MDARYLLAFAALLGCYSPSEEPACGELPTMRTADVSDGCGWGWSLENYPPMPECQTWGATEVNGCVRTNAYACGNGVSATQAVDYGREPWIRTVFYDSRNSCRVEVFEVERSLTTAPLLDTESSN